MCVLLEYLILFFVHHRDHPDLPMGHTGDWWHCSTSVVDMEETKVPGLTIQAFQEMEIKKEFEQLH